MINSLSVAVATVTYRGGDASLRWADAIAAAWQEVPAERRGELRAIAVDNASGDGTARRLREYADWVDVLELPRNAGFAAGCNHALRAAVDAELVVLLNPDVAVAPDFFLELAALAWPAGVAAVGPLVIGKGGEVEQSARGFPRAATAAFGRTALFSRLFPRSRLARRELLAAADGGCRDVDWVSGACMVIPRAALSAVGPFDEGYFMYWEDADWCRRARDAGFSVRYCPQLAVSHHQGSSSASRPFATTVAFHRSAYRYYRVHVARNQLTGLAAGAGLSARCALKLVATAGRRLRS